MPLKQNLLESIRGILMVQTFKWIINTILSTSLPLGVWRARETEEPEEELKLHLVFPLFQSLDINER